MGSLDFRRHSRRSKSLSYTDSLISDDSSATSASSIPSTPLRYLGIPFSWEQFPGIPKKNTFKKLNESSQNLLPLPPSSNTNHQSPSPTMMKKNKSSQSFRKDPFFAALVECSKDNNNGKELEESNRSAGFVVSMYSSCKRTCAVSESIVYRRRSPADYL